MERRTARMTLGPDSAVPERASSPRGVGRRSSRMFRGVGAPPNSATGGQIPISDWRPPSPDRATPAPHGRELLGGSGHRALPRTVTTTGPRCGPITMKPADAAAVVPIGLVVLRAGHPRVEDPMTTHQTPRARSPRRSSGCEDPLRLGGGPGPPPRAKRPGPSGHSRSRLAVGRDSAPTAGSPPSPTRHEGYEEDDQQKN